jgi:hypothetical protein
MKPKTIVENMFESEKVAVLALFNEIHDRTDGAAKNIIRDVMVDADDFSDLSDKKFEKIALLIHAQLKDE